MAISYVVRKLSRIFERGGGQNLPPPPAGRGLIWNQDDLVHVGSHPVRIISFLTSTWCGVILSHMNQDWSLCGGYPVGHFSSGRGFSAPYSKTDGTGGTDQMGGRWEGGRRRAALHPVLRIGPYHLDRILRRDALYQHREKGISCYLFLALAKLLVPALTDASKGWRQNQRVYHIGRSAEQCTHKACYSFSLSCECIEETTSWCITPRC